MFCTSNPKNWWTKKFAGSNPSHGKTTITIKNKKTVVLMTKPSPEDGSRLNSWNVVWKNTFDNGFHPTNLCYRPDFCKITSWILHQDITPAHNALSVKHYLLKSNIPVKEHHRATSFSSWKWSLCPKDPGLSLWMQWKQKRRSSDSQSASNVGHSQTKLFAWLKLCVTVQRSPQINAPPSWSSLSSREWEIKSIRFHYSHTSYKIKKNKKYHY